MYLHVEYGVHSSFLMLDTLKRTAQCWEIQLTWSLQKSAWSWVGKEFSSPPIEQIYVENCWLDKYRIIEAFRIKKLWLGLKFFPQSAGKATLQMLQISQRTLTMFVGVVALLYQHHGVDNSQKHTQTPLTSCRYNAFQKHTRMQTVVLLTKNS